MKMRITEKIFQQSLYENETKILIIRNKIFSLSHMTRLFIYANHVFDKMPPFYGWG